MMRVCLLAMLSHWLRNPLQLFALVAGLAIATALWSGVQAINSEARASYDSAAAMLSDGQYDQLVSKQGNSIPQNVYVKLLALMVSLFSTIADQMVQAKN